METYFSNKRRRYLVDQGYAYVVRPADGLVPPDEVAKESAMRGFQVRIVAKESAMRRFQVRIVAKKPAMMGLSGEKK